MARTGARGVWGATTSEHEHERETSLDHHGGGPASGPCSCSPSHLCRATEHNGGAIGALTTATRGILDTRGDDFKVRKVEHRTARTVCGLACDGQESARETT